MCEAIAIDFRNSSRGNVKVIDGKKTTKLTKDGRIKQTPNNSKKNRDTVVNIKESDIPRFMEYFDSKIDDATDIQKRKAAVRNKVMFVCGINIGLRVSDLVQLKWSTIFFKNGSFRDGVKVKPDKTRHAKDGKGKLVFLSFNDAFRKAINLYMEENKIEVDDENYDDYLFPTRQSDHISADTWSIIVSNSAKEIGITYPVCSHSLRKTFARSRYDHADDKNMVLIQLQMLFGHESTLVTLKYICIMQEELVDLYNSVNLGL